jgi:predicted ATPase/DNA-binding winged helix-turn-helix (wHTH) protein
VRGDLVVVCDDTAVVVAFDEFELDPARFELRRDGQRVALEPQVFEVLAYLVAHADRVVTKHELLDEVWGSRFVSESALTSRIKTARQALGDDGRTQRYIRTVHGRGYRFVAPRTDGAASGGGGLLGLASGHGNLPVDRTPLFGRDADVGCVGDAVAEHRLVSLLGIGGTGKTRLAIAAARALGEDFPDGTWFVDLVPVADTRGIELALADTVRLGLGGDRPVRDQLAALLAARRALFVLDNAEHVADELTIVLDHLLEHTTAPRFVVTSRVPLGLPDERRLPIDPLALDPDDGADDSADRSRSPALALLTSAAERFGAPLADTDPDVLRRICRSLDGLPLAIELAAAQLRHLDAEALADRLDRRFDVLADRLRPGRERHASLQAVLTDTWEALDAAERELLEQLAAFPTTFALDDLVALTAVGAAASPPADVELALGGLVDHSLVVREAGRVSRYRLLETVKRFTRQQCEPARSRAIDDCHAAWCLTAVGDDPRRYVFDFDVSDWCADHFADLRAAVGHLRTAGRSVDAARLFASSALAMHADIGSRAAAVLEWVAADLATIDEDALAIQLHLTAVMCGMATRSPATIAEHGEQALDLARLVGDPVLLNAALVLCSWSTVFADPAAALAMTVEAGEIAAASDDSLGRDFADGYRAFHLAMMRRYDEAEAVARAVMERAPADARRTYPTHVAVAALTSLTCVHDPEGTLPLADEVLAVASERNSMWANDLIAATIHAANGHAAVAADITDAIRTRLEQAGQDPWPDLLVPATAYAVRRGEMARAAGWLDAIRAAGRPTQSFQATILYRRLRDAVGDTDTEPPTGDTLEEIGTRALTWLASGPRAE